MNIQIQKSDLETQFNFRKGSFQDSNDNWKKEGEMLVKNQLLDPFTGSDLEKKAFVINHQTKYIKIYKEKNNWFAQISIPAIDPHKEEIELLERQLTIFINGIRWE